LIPGINDEHMPEVNAAIRERGAFLHNIMPLISAPEHGTYFGLNGQPGPTPKELKAVQDKCSGNMKLMRHCRQCRADAVGLLGEDRSQEFTKEKFMEMSADYSLETRQAVHIGIQQFKAKVQAAKELASKGSEDSASSTPSPKILVAVASKGGGLVNQHFGHVKEFMIYEVDANEAKFIGHRKIADYCQGGYGEEAALDGILKTIEDCKAIFAMKVGPCPQKAIQEAGIEVVEDYGVIEAIARKYYDQAFLAESETEASVIA
jgi:nitrogen fixation protein NifB